MDRNAEAAEIDASETTFKGAAMFPEET